VTPAHEKIRNRGAIRPRICPSDPLHGGSVFIGAAAKAALQKWRLLLAASAGEVIIGPQKNAATSALR